jgi:hypothetical protein
MKKILLGMMLLGSAIMVHGAVDAPKSDVCDRMLRTLGRVIDQVGQETGFKHLADQNKVVNLFFRAYPNELNRSVETKEYWLDGLENINGSVSYIFELFKAASVEAKIFKLRQKFLKNAIRGNCCSSIKELYQEIKKMNGFMRFE